MPSMLGISCACVLSIPSTPILGPATGARSSTGRWSCSSQPTPATCRRTRRHIADRIDRDPAEGFEIIDYKTGRTPTEKMVKTGFSPQLPLEAAVLRAGGFDKLATGEVAALAYWKMSGGREAGKITSLDGVGQLTEDAAQGLARRVVFFSDPATPYAPRVKPMFESDSGDYDHLARVRAWSAAGGEDGE